MRWNHRPWRWKCNKQVAGRYIGCGARGCRVVRCWFGGWKGWALRSDSPPIRMGGYGMMGEYGAPGGAGMMGGQQGGTLNTGAPLSIDEASQAVDAYLSRW